MGQMDRPQGHWQKCRSAGFTITLNSFCLPGALSMSHKMRVPLSVVKSRVTTVANGCHFVVNTDSSETCLQSRLRKGSPSCKKFNKKER